MNKKSSKYDVLVIGGGPAGIAAAISAEKNGAKVLLLERENALGGILKQCIHDGFGIIRYNEKLAGCEYASREIDILAQSGCEVQLLSFVSKIEKNSSFFRVEYVCKDGLKTIDCYAIVLATGCRERSAKQVDIHGSHPAGVLSAGTAQCYLNILGQLPGKRCVILGSGDIGLIMARRLSIEGAAVLGVYEAKPEPSGLRRNIYQCLYDYDIPLHLSKTVSKVHGKERLCAVSIVDLDENMKPILGSEEYIPCDTLILSVGLIPENELAEKLGVIISPHTKGPVCDENFMTSVEAVFSCGNALHVNDLVDYVSESGALAGAAACKKAKEMRLKDKNTISLSKIKVNFSDNFLYLVPQEIESFDREAVFYFRSRKAREKTTLIFEANGELIFKKTYQSLRPPEMERIAVDFPKYRLSKDTILTARLESE